MRSPRQFLSTFLFSLLASLAFAAELRVQVLDPDSATVAGARVGLYRGGTSISVQTTSARGLAVFPDVPEGSYTVGVLATGFKPQNVAVVVRNSATVTAQLAVAGASETVVVTATRTPVSIETSGATVAWLDSAALETLQPVTAADVLRFLPGAVEASAGRRGGLG
ncbi:MAG TPA: carboxypeptidase regulatory-like domain-containing protein, partial [Terriglobales bacterium]|nr:carboxypeptidase regulatory-like domain-containing protein [Terriglobales bacterium]